MPWYLYPYGVNWVRLYLYPYGVNWVSLVVIAGVIDFFPTIGSPSLSYSREHTSPNFVSLVLPRTNPTSSICSSPIREFSSPSHRAIETQHHLIDMNIQLSSPGKYLLTLHTVLHQNRCPGWKRTVQTCKPRLTFSHWELSWHWCHYIYQNGHYQMCCWWW